MDVITTLPELRAKIAECNDVLTHRSDDAMRLLFNSFRMDFSSGAPSDPFSPEYRAFQMAIYETLARKPYQVANERSDFDTAGKAADPFPYYLKSAWTAGHHLLAIGFMLCKLDLPTGSRILEFGPGWGNTTIELARLGYDVTTLDIDPNFCQVVRDRAAHMNVPVRAIDADFFWIERTDETFDGALFFASFHHCDDHMRLLRALHRIVRPGGRVFLASEPIIGHYGTPWGVRMDGEALWAAHNFGWLELGFDNGYFKQALDRTGWTGLWHDCNTVPWASVWELRRTSELPTPAPAPPPPPPPEPIPTPTEDPALAEGRQAILELAALRRSTSWRLTRPLRLAKTLLDQRPGRRPGPAQGSP